MKKLSYEKRLSEYEREKKQLQQQPLSHIEYQQAVLRLAEKWRV